MKLHTYGVYSRQRALHRPIHTAADIYQYALPLLASLESEFKDKGGLKIRLMGLRGTSLVDRKKKIEGFWGRWAGEAESVSGTKRKRVDADGWEIWPQEEFEETTHDSSKTQAELREDEQEVEGAKDITLEILSQGIASTENLHDTSYKGEERQLLSLAEQQPESEREQPWQCPICNHSLSPDDKLFNEHVDWCLSRDTIRSVVKESTSAERTAQKTPPPKRPKIVEEKKLASGSGSGHRGVFPLFKQRQR